ncbi:hypothetical protein MRX96_038582 [Rhipicephalus microplus]
MTVMQESSFTVSEITKHEQLRAPDLYLMFPRSVRSARASAKAAKSSRSSRASTQSKASSASSKSSKASEKSASSGKGVNSDTKRKSSEATSSKTGSRRSIATTKNGHAPSPRSSSKTQRPADTYKAAANSDDAKPAESRPTRKSSETRKLSNEAEPPAGETGSQHEVSPKPLHKSTDDHKPKDQRDVMEEDVEKKAPGKASEGDGRVANQPMEDDGNRSVRPKWSSQMFSLLKSKSVAVLNVAGRALPGRATPKPRPGKSKTPAESVGPSKAEVSDARASLVRLAAMHEESGHSELDSQQQRCLALGGALSLTLLMIIFFSVVSYILSSGAPTIPVACETYECAAAKEYVEGLLGDPKLRCVDFYNYVCGRMITNNMSASAATLGRLHNRLMSAKQKTPDWQGSHVAARVYRGCQAFLDMGQTPVATMRDAAKTIKSDTLRGAKNFAQIIMVLVSVSLQRGLHTVLEVGLVRYAEGSPIALRLTPGRSIQRKFPKDNQKDLQQNLKAAFAWAPEVNATEAMNVVLAVDKHVEEAFVTSDGASDDYEENGSFHSFVYNILPVVPTDVWVSAVTASNPDFLVAGYSTPCFATALSGVRGAFRQVARVGVHNAASYLAANLEAEIAIFEYARQNLNSKADAKRRFCLDTTRRSMLSAWHPLVATILKTYGRDGEVRRMFGALRRVFAKSEGARGESKRSAMNYADFTPSMAETKDFVDAYLSTLRQTQRLQSTAPPSRWQVVYADMGLVGTVVYDRRLRAIVVPPILMTEPYFYDGALPLHFDYGTVGALIAVRIAQIFGAEVSQAGSKTTRALGRQGDLPATKDSDIFNRSIQCIQKLRRQLSPAAASDSVREDVLLAWMQASILRCNVSQVAQILFTQVSEGLRAAYEALLAWFTEESGDPEVFNRYWPTAEVLFFARFCLLSCGGTQRRHTGDSHVPPRERCLLPLHNMPQFAEVFECAGNKDFVGRRVSALRWLCVSGTDPQLAQLWARLGPSDVDLRN